MEAMKTFKEFTTGAVESKGFPTFSQIKEGDEEPTAKCMSEEMMEKMNEACEGLMMGMKETHNDETPMTAENYMAEVKEMMSTMESKMQNECDTIMKG